MPLSGFDAVIDELNGTTIPGMPGVTPLPLPTSPIGGSVDLPTLLRGGTAPTYPTAGAMDRQAMQSPDRGGGGLEQILRLIAPMMTVGLALSGNKAAATGAAQGLTESMALQDQLRRQRELDALRRQDAEARRAAQIETERRQLEAEQRRQEEADRLRAQTVLNTVEDVKRRKGEFRSKREYDDYVSFIEQSLSHLGVRPGAIRNAVGPFEATAKRKEAAAIAESLIKRYGVEGVMEHSGVVPFDKDGDGTPEMVSFRELAEFGEVPLFRDPVSGALTKPPAGVTSANVEEFDLSYRGVLSEFKRDGKNVNDPEIQAVAAAEARKRMREAGRVPRPSRGTATAQADARRHALADFQTWALKGSILEPEVLAREFGGRFSALGLSVREQIAALRKDVMAEGRRALGSSAQDMTTDELLRAGLVALGGATATATPATDAGAVPDGGTEPLYRWPDGTTRAYPAPEGTLPRSPRPYPPGDRRVPPVTSDPALREKARQAIAQEALRMGRGPIRVTNAMIDTLLSDPENVRKLTAQK